MKEMARVKVGTRVSLKCGKDYQTIYGEIVELIEVSGIPAAMVSWDNGERDYIHLTKIKRSNARYGLKLA